MWYLRVLGQAALDAVLAAVAMAGTCLLAETVRKQNILTADAVKKEAK